MLIKNFNFNTTRVTAIAVDTTTNNYLWIAFAKNTSNVCVIQKVSANDLSQVYYEFSLPVEEIVDLHIFSSYLYALVDDATNLFYKIGVSSPLTIQTAVAIPSGINEAPIQIVDDTTDLYILTPGTSPENSKIAKYTTSPTLTEIIDLEGGSEDIFNVIGLTIDGTDLWVITSSSPSKLVRVYQLSGGIYTYTITNLIV